MKTYTSSSMVKPPTWDLDSSEVVVYNNHNVIEIPATDDSPIMYKYRVDEYTKQEYNEAISTEIINELEAEKADMKAALELLGVNDNG